MRGIKIPQYEFALKMLGGLMREGGVFAGHYGTTYYTFIYLSIHTYIKGRVSSKTRCKASYIVKAGRVWMNNGLFGCSSPNTKTLST